MKYYKLEYSANQPSVKQVGVPLNSDFGVAVKVLKNGQLVDGNLSVGGVESIDGPDNWKLVALKSGANGGIVEYPVKIEKNPTFKKEEECVYDTTGKANKNFSPMAQYTLSAIFNYAPAEIPDNVGVRCSDIIIDTPEFRLSSEDGWGDVSSKTATWEVVTFKGDQIKYDYQGSGLWWDTTNKWYETIPLNTIKILRSTTSQFPFGTETYARAVSISTDVEIDTHDSANYAFTLQANQQDKGYFDIEKTEEPVEEQVS